MYIIPSMHGPIFHGNREERFGTIYNANGQKSEDVGCKNSRFVGVMMYFCLCVLDFKFSLKTKILIEKMGASQ